MEEEPDPELDPVVIEPMEEEPDPELDPVVIEPMEEEPDPELDPVPYFEPDPNLISTCDVEKARNVPEDVLDDFFGLHELDEKYLADQREYLHLPAWRMPSTLRMGSDTSPGERRLVIEAVGRLNNVLPDGVHINIGEDREYLHLPAWRMPSTLRMGSDTSPGERRLVIEAVGRLNNVLPDGVHINIGEDIEPLASRIKYNPERGSYEIERDMVKGFIHAYFLSIDEDKGFKEGGLGYADSSGEILCGGEMLCKGNYNLDQVTGLTKTRGAIVILAEKDLAEHHGIFDDEILLRIIVHELLHVMGLGHTDYSYAYGSVMSRDPWVSETVPGVLDCAGLINLYERKRWIRPLD